MFMVLVLHILGHGGVLENTEPFTWTHNIVWLLEIAAYGAVDCYALISGYVGVYSKHRYSSFIVLWLRVVFYSFIFTVINKLVVPDAIGMKKIIFSLFPICRNTYWYFTSYFILFLFIPLLNHCLISLNKVKIQVFLISILAVTSIVIPIVGVFGNDGFGLGKGYSPWWLMILYVFGGYIRKYGLFANVKKRYLLLIFFMSFSVTWLSKIVIQIATNHIWNEIKHDDIFVSYLSLTVLISAVSLLILFSKIHFCQRAIRMIAFLSPLAFSVYLIHEHPFIQSQFITDKFIWITNLPLYAIVPVVIGCALLIYIICSLLDVGRFYLYKWLKVKERLSAFEMRIKKISSRLHSGE